MKRTRLFVLVLAVTMLLAVFPLPASAKEKTTSYDFTGIFSGATCGSGTISFAYGIADTAAALAADPSKLIALDRVVQETEGQFSGANWYVGPMYKSSGEGRDYSHFVKNPGNGFTCLMPQKGVQNAVVFTAPVNGDYTFNAQIYNGWGGTDTDFEAYANGVLVKKQTIGSGNNVTAFENSDATYLKAGEKMYFFFVHTGTGSSYIRFNSFTVTGTAVTRADTSTYDLTGIFTGATCGNGTISFAYGISDTAAALAADPSGLIALDKLVKETEGSFSGANWFADLMYKSTAGDKYAHFVRNPGNKRTCLQPSEGVQNAIVFTAPVSGDYTFSAQIYNGWGATDTVFEAYAKGALIGKQTITSGSNVNTFETAVPTHLDAGERMYVFFVHVGNGDSYVRIDSFTVTGTADAGGESSAESGQQGPESSGEGSEGEGTGTGESADTADFLLPVTVVAVVSVGAVLYEKRKHRN